jgi:O-antigen/teichoic acid export membrane protein
VRPLGADAQPAHAPLRQRLFSNYVFQSMNLGIRLFEQFLLIPLYIFAWGTELYKDWLVLFALVVFFNFCDFGIDDFFGNMFLRAVATGDQCSLERHVRVGLFAALSVTAVMLAAIIAMFLLVPVDHVLGLSAMDERTAMFCLAAMLAPLLTGHLSGTLHGIYRAFGDFSRGECLFAIYNTLQIAGIAVLLALRQPPILVALWYGGLAIAYSIARITDILRRYPISLGLAVPKRAEWSHTIGQSLLYFTASLSQLLTQNGTLVVFGHFGIGAATLVQYNVLRVFTGLTRQLGCQSFVVGSGIEMARQHAQAQREACRKLYEQSGVIVACLVGLLAGVSIPMSGPFVALWTHHTVSGDTVMMLCFLAGIFISAPGRVSLMLLRYSNQARPIAIANTAQSVGGIVAAVAFLPLYGVTAAVAAFAVAEALAVGIYPALVVRSTFGFGAARHMLHSLVPGAAVFLVSYALAAALFQGAPAEPMALGVRAIAWAVIMGSAAGILIGARAIVARFRPPIGLEAGSSKGSPGR